MTDEFADEQEMPPEPEDNQPAGEDNGEPEVSPNPRDTGAYRIDQLLAQNLRGALVESKRRTGEAEEVDEPEPEPEPAEPAQEVIVWKETTGTFSAAREAAELPVIGSVDEEAASFGVEPEEDGPPLLHHDEVVRASQRMKAVSEGISSFMGKPKPSVDEDQSIWQKLVRKVRPTQEMRIAEAEDRLRTLDEAIEDGPDVAVNYLARAELLLEIGRVVEAIDDFERVETLAAKDFEDRRWGVVAQALRDRAQRGIAEAQKRL